MSSVILCPRFARYSQLIPRRTYHSVTQLHLSNDAITRPRVHHQIHPPRLPSRTMITAESATRNDIAILLLDKWGWVIYRCTYADNEAWARFRARVEVSSRESIAQSDAPEIADRLEWTWVEDAASLDGISTAALRERFRAWSADEVAQQPGNYSPDTVSRLRYFIKIDQQVLQNLAGYLSPEMRWELNDFVKFVDGYWEPSRAIAAKGLPAEEPDDEGFKCEGDIWEPIDGCT